MATIEEIQAYLRQQGLQLTDDQLRQQLADRGINPEDVSADMQVVPEEPKKATQPRWKWSWDPEGGLLLWSVEPKQGRPHHIEVTGPNFWQLAQGRIYVNPDGTVEILVWEDRGPEDWQDQAVEDVQSWLRGKLGLEGDVYYQGEGGYYQTINLTKGPDRQRMTEAYFGVDFSKLDENSRQQYLRSYDTVLKSYEGMGTEEKASEARLNFDDPEWGTQVADVCPSCNGEGADLSGHLCPTCKGSGIAPR